MRYDIGITTESTVNYGMDTYHHIKHNHLCLLQIRYRRLFFSLEHYNFHMACYTNNIPDAERFALSSK